MPASQPATVEEYLARLPPDRREAVEAVRRVILDRLPDGYEEVISFGMIGYVIPLERYPNTYNGQPLTVAALASQKNYISLYLNAVYADADREHHFTESYRASGKRLDMGKSCVRFKTRNDLPLDVVGDAIAATPVDDYIALYETSRAR